MKQKNLFGILLVFIITFCFPSCDKDDDGRTDPIMLSYGNNVMFDNVSRCISITPFVEATTPLYINGGDGHYVIDSPEEVIDVEYNGETVIFKPLALGKAVVTIRDNSGNRYDLTIRVEYSTYTYIVTTRKCIVEGDNMTVGSKKELEHEIISLATAERYEFTFTDKEGTQGTVRLYGQKTGGEANYEEYNFDNEQLDTILTINGENVRALARVVIKGESGDIPFYITLDPGISKSTGGDMIVTKYCFIKDLTERYHAGYPAMEKVYEVQAVYWKR